MKSFAAAAVLLVPLALASCTEETAGPLSEQREPASISISAADIELDDGDTLQVFANVRDQHENVFSALPDGLEIEWSSDDEGVVDVTTDGRLIGVAPGTATVTAEASDGLDASAAVLVRPVATGLELVSGGAQDGLPNAPLADSVELRVIDRHGNGVADAEVRFRVTSGGGSISPSTAISDASGLVRVEWTLGPVIGDQAIQALAPGAGGPIAIDATISQLVSGGIDVPSTATQGGTLAGAVRLDSDLFPIAIGGAHVVISWDPAKLQLQPASMTAGDYERAVQRYDNAAGELHLIVTDPAMTRGDMSAAGFTFDVVGGAGTTTTIALELEQLVGVNFLDASAAGVTEDVVVTIN